MHPESQAQSPSMTDRELAETQQPQPSLWQASVLRRLCTGSTLRQATFKKR